MKKILAIAIALAMCATSALCAEITPKKKGPSTKAYERASDKASFKRTVEPKEKVAKKDIDAKSKNATREGLKGKKKGFLWW